MLEHAVRRVRRHPARALLVIITLGLGLGATTAIVSAIRGVLLVPLPYPHPEQLVMVKEMDDSDSDTVGFTTYDEWRRSAKSFASLTAVATRSYTLMGSGEPEQLALLGVTHEAFETFGVRPLLGREFTPQDDVRGAARVVVLSYELWSRRYGRDSSIVGRTIRMSDLEFEVIGVMPPRMRIIDSEWRDQHIDAWGPLRYNTTLEWACRSCRHLRTFGRLRPGVTLDQASREIEQLTAAMRRAYPRDYAERGGTAVQSLQDVIVGRSVASSLWIILALAAVVLLAAITNAGSLRLSELFIRQNELVVRQSLGATPMRVASMLILESIVQAIAASLLGIGIAYAAIHWLRLRAGSFLPRAADLAVDPFVVAICVATALLSGIAIGLIPAFRARRWSLVTTGRSVATGRGVVSSRSAAQMLLVGINVALSVILLVGTVLVLRSVRNLFATPPGFEAANVISFRVAVAGQQYDDPKLLGSLYDRFTREGQQLPGIQSVALTSQLPFAEDQDNAGLTPEDRAATAKPGDFPDAQRFAVSADYFKTLRIPVLRGRAFTNADVADSEPVVILNATAARALWSDGNALDQRVRIAGGEGNPFRRVIGIVGDVAPGDLGARAKAQAYLPLAQFTPTDVTGIARMPAQRLSATEATPLRALMHRLDPDVAFYRIATLPSLVAGSEARRRFILACLTSFSIVALILAMIGVYGILSLFVSSRTRELGLRMALGASATGVFRLVLSQGLRLVGVGLLIGIAASLFLGRFLAPILFGVATGDPATLLPVLALLLVASAIACAIPAWRAGAGGAGRGVTG
jgi:putative ABC transport system permease protein